MHYLLAFTTPIPATAAQLASIWAIRFALVFMTCVLITEITFRRKATGGMALLWLAGALCAGAHSLGSLATFHGWNHTEAFESTAQQTEELLGFRVGLGLYVNYLFVAVWLFDALLRVGAPHRYTQFPKYYTYFIYGFLLFIAFNGAIVFKAGWLRMIGIVVAMFLVLLAFFSTNRERSNTAAKHFSDL